MITKSLPIAENSIERIEAIISKLGPTLNFTEISELAVAIHEIGRAHV
jgi:flagellin-specific chaperone FliS